MLDHPLHFFLDWLFSIDNVLPLDQERDSISDAFKQIESLNALSVYSDSGQMF